GYHSSKDILRTNVPTTSLDHPLEALTMIFEKAGPHQINLVVAWDTTQVKLPIQVL
ncbi:MAG: DUF2911 domain-containing protein, partial [Chitinophagaceae bacterium]